MNAYLNKQGECSIWSKIPKSIAYCLVQRNNFTRNEVPGSTVGLCPIAIPERTRCAHVAPDLTHSVFLKVDRTSCSSTRDDRGRRTNNQTLPTRPCRGRAVDRRNPTRAALPRVLPWKHHPQTWIPPTGVDVCCIVAGATPTLR